MLKSLEIHRAYSWTLPALSLSVNLVVDILLLPPLYMPGLVQKG